MKKGVKGLLALLSVAMLTVTACGGAGGQTGSNASYGPKQTVIVAESIGDAVSLDPQVAYEFASVQAAHFLYSNLVTYANGDTTNPVPGVAEKWDMSPDGMTWTFHLKKGLKFASGNEITADDVVYSFERVVNLPKDPAAWLITQMGIDKDNVTNQVKALDKYTVQIKLVKATAPGAFLAIMAYPTTGIVDSKVVKQHVKDNDWGFNWLTDHSAGGGPYVLDKWDRDAQIVMTANAKYNLGPVPAIKRVILKHTPESTAQFDMIQKGDADVATNLTAEQQAKLKGNAKFTVLQSPDLSLAYLGLDVKNVPAFAKPEARLAIKYAIDYKGIVDQLLSGNGILNQSIVPKGMYGYDSDTPFQQDIAKAKDLLKQAGYPDGFAVEMLVSNGSAAGGIKAADLAAKLKSDLAKIGVTVNIRQMQSSELYKTYRGQKAQTVLANWGADYPDPDDFAKPFGDYSMKSLAWRLQWDDPALSKLVEQAGSLPNGDQRAALYKQINQYEMEKGPFVILYQPLRTTVISTGLQNVHVNPLWGIEFQDLSKK